VNEPGRAAVPYSHLYQIRTKYNSALETFLEGESDRRAIIVAKKLANGEVPPPLILRGSDPLEWSSALNKTIGGSISSSGNGDVIGDVDAMDLDVK